MVARIAAYKQSLLMQDLHLRCLAIVQSAQALVKHLALMAPTPIPGVQVQMQTVWW